MKAFLGFLAKLSFSLTCLASAPSTTAMTALSDLGTILGRHLVPIAVAKEICSCLYNSRLPLETCRDKVGLPNIAEKTPILRFAEDENTITVLAIAIAPSFTKNVFYKARAVFDKRKPRLGCRLIFD